MSIRPPEGADGLARVPVRLSQVPEKLRMAAAEMLTKKMDLTSWDALEISMAAAAPAHDPLLYVSPEKASLVLEQGRFPAGPFPTFE